MRSTKKNEIELRRYEMRVIKFLFYIIFYYNRAYSYSLHMEVLKLYGR